MSTPGSDELCSTIESWNMGDEPNQPSSTLCVVCRKMLDFFSYQSNPYLDWYKSIEDVRQSVTENGCSLCFQFWRGADTDLDRALVRYKGWKSRCLTLNARGHERPGTRPFGWDLYHPLGASKGWKTVYVWKVFVGSSPVPGQFSAVSRNNLGLAYRWLEECFQTHSECNHSSPAQNPTRLLVLDEDKLHICLTASLPSAQPLRYVTLSHRWGSQQYLTLTDENLETFLVEIPEAELSRSVLDAIEICRYLGYGYLWVDTLCIIQGNEQDWSREAALMADVYGGSEVTIAASSARDGREGCFYDRPSYSSCVVDEHLFVSDNMTGAHLNETPLLRRGWVLQERILSRRVLHFEKSEVFWECHHMRACESLPHGGIPSLHPSSGWSEHEPLEPHLWNHLANIYSRCCLTYSTDKLVAISGLARYINRMQNPPEQYCVGMWKRSLEHELCWYALEPQPRSASLTVSPTYIAPSWSWVSSPGPIRTWLWGIYRESSQYYAKVQEVAIDHATQDVYGAILSATLRMSCKTLARLTHDEEASRDSIKVTWIKPDHSDMKVGTTMKPRTQAADAQSGAQVDTIYAFPIVANDRTAFGILLEPQQARKGVYTRVGSFQCSTEEMVQLYLKANGFNMDESGCCETKVDENGETTYIIEII